MQNVMNTELALFYARRALVGQPEKMTPTQQTEYNHLVVKALGEMLQRENGCYDD